MPRLSRAACMAFLLLFVLAARLTSQEPARAPSRVVIRGSGSDVRLERVPTPEPPRMLARGGVLAEATRLAASGSDDTAVLTYLREHQRDLPAVLDASSLAALRRAGAGEAATSFLLSTAAVDVGPTGEGGTPSPSALSDAAGAEPYAYVADGYYGGGYGGYYGGGYGPAFGSGWRFGHGRFPTHAFGFRFGLHPTHPIVRPGGPKFPFNRGRMGHMGGTMSPHRRGM